jgi:hypothetical protein
LPAKRPGLVPNDLNADRHGWRKRARPPWGQVKRSGE